MKKTAENTDEPPPVGGSWRNVYIGIALYLVFLIAVFDAFTRAWNR